MSASPAAARTAAIAALPQSAPPKPPCSLVLLRSADTTRLLLAVKKRGFGMGKFNGFGGKLEAGETMDECAFRETLEESGCEAQDLEKVGLLHFTFAAHPGTPTLVHVYKGRLAADAKPVETEEMAPRWFYNSIKCMPLGEMWADDEFWMPYFFRGVRFRGRFHYVDQTTIVRHEMESVGPGEEDRALLDVPMLFPGEEEGGGGGGDMGKGCVVGEGEGTEGKGGGKGEGEGVGIHTSEGGGRMGAGTGAGKGNAEDAEDAVDADAAHLNGAGTTPSARGGKSPGVTGDVSFWRSAIPAAATGGAAGGLVHSMWKRIDTSSLAQSIAETGTGVVAARHTEAGEALVGRIRWATTLLPAVAVATGTLAGTMVARALARRAGLRRGGAGSIGLGLVLGGGGTVAGVVAGFSISVAVVTSMANRAAMGAVVKELGLWWRS